MIRNKSPLLKELLVNLEIQSRRKKAPIWKAVAKGLNRPRRAGYEVNLFELERAVGKKEAVVVPGNVLGEGELARPIEVAALRFSGSAREKIVRAGGKALTIQELMEKRPEGKGIRIVG